MAHSVAYMNRGGYPEFSDGVTNAFLILMAIGAIIVVVRGCVDAWRNRRGK
jgi:hypothetical protein